MRIVSVLPSATEIVCALGAGSELAGRSAECDYPPEVRHLPVVMRPRTDDADRPSAEIDRRVQAARAALESLYELDVPLLARLRPDLLITQDLCGVCSVTEDEVVRACRAAGISPSIVSLSPRTLDDVWASVETVARAIDRPREGSRLAAALRARAVRSREPTSARVAVVEWLDPPILAGLWTPSMIEAAGGVPVGPTPGEVGRRTTWKEIAHMSPDLVVLSPCSFTVERTRAELGRGPAGASLETELAGRSIYLADEAYFSRPGPRLADGVDLLRALLHDPKARFPLPVVRLSPVPEGAAG